MMRGEHAGGTAAPSLARGAAIGRYVVLGLVGRGAMGEVYAAYDPELDRKVAVKLLRTQVGADDLTAAEAKSRLLREAQTIARLSHPNVIVVHDVGSFGDRVFVAMEFVDGHTLGYWLLAAQRTWKEVRQVFMAAGQGLAAAHASQLVHRDFKLENVMVGRDGQVRVMDFGLARRVAGGLPPDERSGSSMTRSAANGVVGNGLPTEADSLSSTRVIPSAPAEPGRRAATPPSDDDLDATNEMVGPLSSGHPLAGRRPAARGEMVSPSLSNDLTQTGAIIGTPAYMAPEQFNGHAADERSDQFSFCVALYEALYGERPFSGKSLPELSANVRHGRIRLPPDSTRVPGWLRRVVVRGLRTDPNERWPSIDALLAALQKDPRVLWRRAAVMAVALSGIAGIGIAARRQGALENRPTCQVSPDRFARVWESSVTPASRRAAIHTAFHASGQPYAADALAGATRLLDGYVSAWSSMYTESCEATNVRGEQSAEVLDLRTSCLRDRWNELRALSDVLAEPSGEVVVNAVKVAAALTSIDRCADVRTLRAAVAPPNDPALRAKVEALRSKLATAKALEDAGRFAKALSAAAPLVSEARAVGYPPVLAEALHQLALIQSSMRRSNDAKANFDEAIWVAEAARYDEIVAAASTEQIYIAGTVDDDMPAARRWFRQAEAFLARMEGHDLLRAWMHNNFGVALEAHGDLEEAVTRYRKALQIKERVLGGRHPDVGISLTNLASILAVLDRPEEALELSNRGAEITDQMLGSEHPDTAMQWTNRAGILNQLGRFADARRDAARALRVWEKELGPENRDLPYFLGPLGDAYLGLDRPQEAVAPLERGLALAERHDLRSELRRLRFALAQALWRSGSDRGRAVQIASLAALPAAGNGAGGGSRRDKELQQKAADWVSEHLPELRNRVPAPRRVAAARGLAAAAVAVRRTR